MPARGGGAQGDGAISTKRAVSCAGRRGGTGHRRGRARALRRADGSNGEGARSREESSLQEGEGSRPTRRESGGGGRVNARALVAALLPAGVAIGMFGCGGAGIDPVTPQAESVKVSKDRPP